MLFTATKKNVPRVYYRGNTVYIHHRYCILDFRGGWLILTAALMRFRPSNRTHTHTHPELIDLLKKNILWIIGIAFWIQNLPRTSYTWTFVQTPKPSAVSDHVGLVYCRQTNNIAISQYCSQSNDLNSPRIWFEFTAKWICFGIESVGEPITLL